MLRGVHACRHADTRPCGVVGVRRTLIPVATPIALLEEIHMAESVYKVIELVGTSTESWEKAAAAALKRATKSLRDLRVAEVKELDIQMKNGKIEAYRAKIKVSFKFESSEK
jgi:flavin-binding protein dodecin